MTTCLLITEKLFVFKCCVIFIVLGSDTSSHRSNVETYRGSRSPVKGRSLYVCSGYWGN